MNDFNNEELNQCGDEVSAEAQNTAETLDDVAVEENVVENENAEAQEDSYNTEPLDNQVGDQNFSSDIPNWSPVNYTPVFPTDSYKPASKGLRVFAGMLACVLLATATCVAGYFMGRTSVMSGGGTGKKVSINLASRPKDEDMLSPAGVYEKINDSVVGIRVYNTAGQSSDASGVFYSKDGYIVTNDHIYAEVGAPKFKVYTASGEEYDAKYIAGDTISDLAVLKIEGKFDVAEFGNSRELYCGEEVVAVGRPGDASSPSSVTSGIVSLTERRVKTTTSYSVNLIETDSAINPGSSGGALVNMYGQVVGITSAKLAGVVYDSVGYAIPTVTVKRVAEQLIKDGKVTDRAKLGITYTEKNSVIAAVDGTDTVGLLVVTVSSDSDAYGKINENDIITHVNGVKITRDEIMLNVIDNCKAGDKITVTVETPKGDTADYEILLKANVGESSYTDVIKQTQEEDEGSQGGSGGTFNFPYGE